MTRTEGRGFNPLSHPGAPGPYCLDDDSFVTELEVCNGVAHNFGFLFQSHLLFFSGSNHYPNVFDYQFLFPL